MQNPQTPPSPPLPPPATASDSRLTSLTHEANGNDLIVSAAFDGPMKSLTYRLKPNGWLSIDYVYAINGPQEYCRYLERLIPEADVEKHAVPRRRTCPRLSESPRRR